MNIAKYSTITDLVYWQLESVGWSLDGPMMIESTHTTISVDLRHSDYKCLMIINEAITAILKHRELREHPLFRLSHFDNSFEAYGKTLQWCRIFEKEYDYKNPDFHLADITNNLMAVMISYD